MEDRVFASLNLDLTVVNILCVLANCLTTVNIHVKHVLVCSNRDRVTCRPGCGCMPMFHGEGSDYCEGVL